MEFKKTLLILCMLTVLLAGCHSQFVPVEIPEVTEFPEEGIADCAWSGMAVAWVDENQNGQYEPNEQPLPGVVFQNSEGDTVTSNWKGEAVFDLFMPGCGEWDISVSPEIPDGYRLTTPPSQKSSTSDYGEFAFGFVTQVGVPTPTARAAGPSCTQHRLGRANFYDLTDLAITADGTIWVASFNAGVFRLAPNAVDWDHYTESQGLANDQVRSITVENDGSIWFGTSGGASHFDGQTWKSYTTADGLLPADVTGIAIDNNLIWFSTYAGASMLDLDTGLWQNFTAANGLLDDFLHTLAVGEDGSIWLAGRDTVSRLIWPERPAGTPTWSYYDTSWVNSIKHDANGTLWFAGFSGIQYFDPKVNALQDYTAELSNIDFQPLPHSLAFGPDDSMLIGSEVGHEIFRVLKDAGSGQLSVRSYDSRDGLPKYLSQDDKVQAIAFAPDGSLWMTTQEDATHCVLSE